MWLYVIGDRDTVIGFRLLGIEGQIIEDLESEITINNLKNLIADLQKRPKKGLLIINEKIAEIIEDLILEIRMNNEDIIVIEIPDRAGTKKPPLDLNYIMKKIVGMKI
ncbi:MAG: V-type ATP synthase subunit F [Candidatus Helarchaeota archaeon]